MCTCPRCRRCASNLPWTFPKVVSPGAFPKVVVFSRFRCNAPGLVVDNRTVTPPRRIHPHQLCFVTVRAVNRRHRFAPARQAVEIIWYCLGYVLSKFRDRIEAHEFLWMSNHYHILLTDRGGCLPDFMNQLNSLLARALNALQGITGTAVEKGYNLVEVTTDDRATNHCTYVLANPCNAGLVERSHHWRSVSSIALEYGDTRIVNRPNAGLWGGPCRHLGRKASNESKRAQYGGRSRLPEQVELVLTRPPIMAELTDEELRAHIRALLAQREEEVARARQKSRKPVLGWRSATRVRPSSSPTSSENAFGRRPNFSAGTHRSWSAAWRRRRAFLESYYSALRRFVAGDRKVEFPAGTWLMKRRFRVSCAVVT